VKKRDLEKLLRVIALGTGREFAFLREGANHETWMLGNERLVIPRHREINEHTARAILNRTRRMITDVDE
jgi:mRNA interferase HicA